MLIRRTVLLAGILALTLGIAAAPTIAAPPGSAEVAGSKKKKKAAKKLTKALKDSNLTGTRGDGATVDVTFCANGKFRSDINNSTFPGKNWRVTNASKKGKRLRGFVKGNAGYNVAVIKKGSKWKFGIAFPKPKGSSYGPVKRSNAEAECKTL